MFIHHKPFKTLSLTMRIWNLKIILFRSLKKPMGLKVTHNFYQGHGILFVKGIPGYP